MTYIAYPAYPPPPPHDRKTGLIVFGIFALVIGAISACMGIMAPLAIMMTRAMPRPANMPPTDPRSLISAVVVYGVVAAAFIACGVGSVRTRRWSRPLMLS